MDCCAHRIVHAEDPNLAGAFGKRASSRTGCLKPYEDNRIPLIRQPVSEMMQDPAAGRHAVCRNDDGWKGLLVYGFRLFHGSHELNSPCPKGIRSGLLQSRHLDVVLFTVSAKYLEGIHGHWAVDVDRQNRNLILILELANDVDQLLCTADGKRRNQDCASAVRCRKDNVAKPVFSAGSRPEYSLGAFQNQVVCTIYQRRIEDDGLIVASDISCKQYRLFGRPASFVKSYKRRAQNVTGGHQVETKRGG